MNYSSIKKLMTVMIIALIISMPMAFAVQINEGSIQATEVTSDSAKIYWTTDTVSDGYVDYGTSINNMKTIPQTGGQSSYHTVNLNNLYPGMKYYYKVRSTDGYTSVDESESYKEFTTLIGSPQNIEVKEVSHDSGTIRWDYVSGASRYRIFLDGVLHSETSAREFEIQPLESNREYTAFIRALDSEGRMSVQSEEVSFTTQVEPVGITFVRTTDITDTSATISWTTSKSVESVIKYDTDLTLDRISDTPGERTEHSITLVNLQSGERYYYQVEAGSSVSERKYFQTLNPGEVGQVIISDVQVVGTTTDSATISWTTNNAADSQVLYGLDDGLGMQDGSSEKTTEHEVLLSNLLSTETYYFKVSSDGVQSDFFTLQTVASNDDFLMVNEPVELTNQPYVNISGGTRLNARVYVFLNENKVAQVREVLNGTKYQFPVKLNSMVNYQDTPGKNLINVVSWDVNGNRDSEIVYVTYDVTPPYLKVQDLPSITNQPEIEIQGISEEGAIIDFYLDNKSQSAPGLLSYANFSHPFNLGRTGVSEIKVTATDEAGNVNEFTHTITIDKDVPEIEFGSSFKPTNFKLYTINGTTEPGATVTVTNLGKYKDCDEAADDLDYVNCEQFLEYQKTSAQLDPLTYALGTERSSTADSSGYFEVTISLLRTDDAGFDTKETEAIDSKNNLLIEVTDKAGNSRHYNKYLIYRPGCKDWTAGHIQSFPFNIYTKDLSAGDIQGSAFFPVHYAGTGVPTVREVTLFKNDAENTFLKDDSNLFSSESNNWVTTTQENNNEYLKLGQPKASKYDDVAKSFHVYAPVTIQRYTGSIQLLPDEMFAYMGIRITYDVPGKGATTCEIYPMISFDVQKPEDILDWLSPEQINKTIAALNETIAFTQDAIVIVRKAAHFGLLACGAMIVKDYVVAFFDESKTGEGTGDGDGSCSEQEESQEKTYLVCDRVMCPTSPPECGKFESTSGDNIRISTDGGKTWSDDQTSIDTALANNAKLRTEYERQKAAGETDANSFEQWYGANNNGGSGVSIGDDSVQFSRVDYPTFTSEVNMDGGDSATVYFDTIAVNNGAIDPTYDASFSSIAQDKGIDPSSEAYRALQTEYNRAIKTCGSGQGTLVVSWRVQNAGASPGDVGILRGSDDIGSTTVKCIPGQTPDQVLMSSDYGGQNADGLRPSTSTLTGCYNPDCPAFDNTKCPSITSFGSIFSSGGKVKGTPGINPPEGLWSSLKCICFPSLLKHLENYLKIMQGAKKCLEQALIGEVKGGFCERLLAQFICDLMIEAFKFMWSSMGDTDTESGGIGGLLGLQRSGANSYKEKYSQINDGLSDRYSGLVNNRMGLSTDQLMHKACVFSMTGDWSMLDDLMNNYLESTDVEPVATLFAESRPYGYDPFTGKMSLNYNVYVGIVPGGETDVRAWLECDVDAPGGEFCGTDVPKKEITGVPSHMRSEDPAFDRNINIPDTEARYWYNKAVLYLSYKVGEEKREQTIVKQIWRKGTLAAGCSFSMQNGIYCEAFGGTFANEDGVVQIVDAEVPPSGFVFRNGASAAAVIKLDNNYRGERFYLRFDIEDGSPQSKEGDRNFEYTMYGANEINQRDHFAGQRVYNLWIDDIKNARTNTGSDSLGGFLISDDINMKLEDPVFSFRLRDSSNVKAVRFTCEGHSTEDPVDSLKANTEVKGTTSSEISCKRAIEEEHGAVTNDKWVYTLVDKYEVVFEKKPIKDVKLELYRIVQSVEKVLLSRTIYEESDYSTNPTTNAEVRKISVDVWEDSDNNYHGDTVLLYDNAETQKKTLEYKAGGELGSKAPVKVQLLEPVGDYFPGKSNIVPLGFNYYTDTPFDLNDNGFRFEIEVKGTGQDNSDMSCLFAMGPKIYDDVYSAQNNCPFVPNVGRIGNDPEFKEKEPPFIEVFLEWKEGYKFGDSGRSKQSIYQVKVTSYTPPEKNAQGKYESEDLKFTTAPKSFRVAEREEITTDSVMVILGCGEAACSGKEKTVILQDADSNVKSPQYNESANRPTTSVTN